MHGFRTQKVEGLVLGGQSNQCGSEDPFLFSLSGLGVPLNDLLGRLYLLQIISAALTFFAVATGRKNRFRCGTEGHG